jgi:hypothetical protein
MKSLINTLYAARVAAMAASKADLAYKTVSNEKLPVSYKTPIPMPVRHE